MKSCDILMLGHFAKDEIIVDGVSEVASGGGVYFGSVAAHRLGQDVAVVTRLREEDFPRLEELRRAGIEVIAYPSDQTSGIANFYASENMETRICKPIGFAGAFTLDQIPNIPCKVILITPLMAGEVDLTLLKQLAQRAPLGMDVQGFVRVRDGDDLIFKMWDDMAEGLKSITYLKVDHAEAQHLTGEIDIDKAARKLASYGPKEIVLTQTSGVTVFANGQFYQAPFTPRSLAGRTGRGDTCFSTYIAMRLNNDPAIATAWAGAVTSIKQETPGPWYGPIEDVRALMHHNMHHG